MKDDFDSANIGNLAFMESLYADYVRDPATVSPEWRSYFKTMVNGDANSAPPQLGPSFRPGRLFNPAAPAAAKGRPAGPREDERDEIIRLQNQVNQLVRNYRVRGHIIARVDPLGQPRFSPPELDPTFLGLTARDLDKEITSSTLHLDEPATVREMIEKLRKTYCSSIAVQYMHIDDITIRRWLQRRMERTENRLQLSREEQIRILKRLTHAVTFEEFIHKKFVGAKSFSLEGSETLIPLLDLAIEKAGEQGIREIVVGMAHRGRLNVLANIMGKNPKQIFREFADADAKDYLGGGDVKYHLGYSGDWQTAAGQKIHLSLCFNPSHLEFVNPVVLGRMRAKQDRANDGERKTGMALLIHGDAAFAGEGIIQETLNLSRLPGYFVGGTLHIILNNQIGFTTGPREARSTPYATDVAKMLQSPIFHVNGEDPEAVAQVVQLAMDFRAMFKRDVFIDMYAYRRLGHNEGDEPSFTQPVLYRAIQQRKSVREGYLEHLLKLNGITREEADRIAQDVQDNLEKELSASTSKDYKKPVDAKGLWGPYIGGPIGDVKEVPTGLPVEKLAQLLKKQLEFPADFHVNPKLKVLATRAAMADGKQPLDWAAAESLAFASLLTEGKRVRLSGQDCGRGTFSQRHAVLHDFDDGHPYIPLQHLAPNQAPVEIINSPLSEAGVLGFDYGYSLDWPDGLVLWEAQYGDFANAATVIIDQFIASAEDKWRRLSGLVMLLPHGFEGSGPEHSSARLERFLALAAEDNMQVVYPTTAAQYFHVLRRQVVRNWRKPLVIMTPKSLLRDPRVASPLADLANGQFQNILPDNTIAPKQVRRILLCSGKIYYDLEKQRNDSKRTDVAIIRIEQLYPLAEDVLQAALALYADGTPAFWVQEEPRNMGAWRSMRERFAAKMFERFPLDVICRPASASPATGSLNAHKQEQQEILTQAFAQK